METSTDIEVNECQLKDYLKKCSTYSNSFISLGIGSVLHPLNCARILIQLGHEPLALERGYSYWLFGRDVYFLPNVFKYIRHVKSEHGWSGIYSGVGSSVCCNIAGFSASAWVWSYLNEKYPDVDEPNEGQVTESNNKAYGRFVKKLSKETASKAVGIIIARPFQVVVIRRVAQLVGGEVVYGSTWASLRAICGEEGLRGVFSGLVPQLVGELMILWVSSTALFAFDRYFGHCFGDDEDRPAREDDQVAQVDRLVKRSWKTVAHTLIPYFVNGVFYPFGLISTIMAVNGSPLKVGRWPHVPIFLHWQDCWDFLAKENQLKRGSKLFLRSYEGAIDFRGGQVFARTASKLAERR